MEVNSRRFQSVARAVAWRVSDFLGTHVSVVDSTGSVVAESGGRSKRGSRDDRDAGNDYQLRVPLHLNGHAGEVVLSTPATGESISPRVAEYLVDLIINQSLATVQLQNRHDTKNKFIQDLLYGLLTDEQDILRQGQILGVDFTRPRAVILIAADYIRTALRSRNGELHDDRVQTRTQHVTAQIVSFFSLPGDAICAYIGDGQIALLKASSTQDLVQWAEPGDQDTVANNTSWANLRALKRASEQLRERLAKDTKCPVSIGVGRYHHGVLGLAASYQDALAALSLGMSHHGENRVYCLDSLGPAAFVGIKDQNTQRDLAEHLLSPLDDDPELLKTLDVYFQSDCSPSQASNRLSIHRNTLKYRLDKVALLTGLNPYCFDDAVQIRLSLLMRSLDNPGHI